MKPRVFISSTYYDLKHVRERIERFIENYNFEPVLFESDNVIFEHGRPIDVSCYNEVKLCHIMILIVGGRYGSIISGDFIKEKKDSYDKEYVSITRKEYETALKMNIPIFVFIDKNVYAEYQTFKKNKQFFDTPNSNNKKDFSFAHVDDVNVFKFISLIHGNAIKTFEKVEEIEVYLSNQIAGMLYLYLEQLQSSTKDKTVLDAVSELQNVSERMNAMLQAVGRNVIQDKSFEEVIFNQNQILIDFFVNQFIDNIIVESLPYDSPIKITSEVYDACKATIFNYDLLKSARKEKEWKKEWEKREKIEEEFTERLKALDDRLKIRSFNYFKIYTSYIDKIYPIVSKDKRIQELLDKKMISEIEQLIYGLPF
jgi:hypothetical protein